MTRFTLRSIALLALAAIAASSPGVATAEEPSGEQIFKADCARCHGTEGQGTAEHSDPLIGDKSVLELSALIAKTMPEDKDEKCSAEDAQKVAAYIHDAFYSPVAQARNKPARIELSRLTVGQLQNSLTDLIGSFREEPKWGDVRGIKGEYYKSRRFRGSNRELERIDPQIKFDFGDASPDAQKFEPHEFSIRWEGMLLAPDTGDYEFIIRTEHAARLWVNDMGSVGRVGSPGGPATPTRPLIDAWVKSGNDTEYRTTIKLLGGRVYPIRLEFSKARQGVDDEKQHKDKPPPGKASIVLEWKRPHLPVEPIPQRYLSPEEPENSHEVFVLTTNFPPDDRSIGYERGTSISKAWDDATTEAAIETAGYVAEHLNELADIDEDEDAEDRKEQLQEFCQQFVERAFRRPLTDEQKKVYIDRQFEQAKDVDTAVKRVILLALKSPRFLYRELDGPQQDAYNVAARLSFGLWDSLPDDELLLAAKKNELSTREQIAAQAERMLADRRSRAKVREFFLRWLKIEQIPDLSKDPDAYPEFNETVAADLRASLDLFVDEIVWSSESDFRQLLLSETLYLNGRLAPLYGADLPADAPFQKVAAGSSERAGILTHPYLLSSFAYTATTSPIHRGVFVSRSLLGRALKPPPEAVTPLAPELHADLTTRERIALQTQSESCMSCHGMINPLGFTLENYDAIGRFRKEENGKPIDTSGGYLTRTGEQVKFSGARELAKFLTDSEETHKALVEQMFHHLVKQPVRAYGPDRLPQLTEAFRKNEFSIRKLLVDIMAASSLPPETPKPAADSTAGS